MHNAIRSSMITAAAALLLLSACGEGENGNEDGGSDHALACGEDHAQVTAEQVYTEVFGNESGANCVSCHNPGVTDNRFRPEPSADGLRAAVGQDSDYAGDVKVIDPNRAENSTLILKINGGSPRHRGPKGEAVGPVMPPGIMLPEAQLKLFQDWICTGAK